MMYKHIKSNLPSLAAALGVSFAFAAHAQAQVITPTCETPTETVVYSGASLDGAMSLKDNVTFTAGNLVFAAGGGSVRSEVVDLATTTPAIDTTEAVITGARIMFTPTPPVDAAVYMSTSKAVPFFEANGQWVEAYRCDGTATDSEFCVRFPAGDGRDLRWRLEMAGASISSVQLRFDHVADNENFRGGVTVSDGVSYFGGFSEPGDLGQMHALPADFAVTDIYWEGRDKLQIDGNRDIYTASPDGTQRLDFVTGNYDPLMYDIFKFSDLGVPVAQYDAMIDMVVDWYRNALRFGNAFDADPPAADPGRRFGAVVNSTPAVVGRPKLPTWFARAPSAQRLLFNTYQINKRTRPPLVIYGAKDGMVHAVYSNAVDIANSANGTEAWAFVPPSVASNFLVDALNSQDYPALSPMVTAYPDTSPIIEEVVLATGEFATIAILPDGSGGSGVSVLDITNSVIDTPFTSNGPTPLWQWYPGGTEAGLATNQPAVARVRITGDPDDHYFIITGTGSAYDDPTHQKGRDVVAYDLETGAVRWSFRMQCSLSTDITVFETDDGGEPVGTDGQPPIIDGYIDRAIFGDRCGNIYKVDVTEVIDNSAAPTGIGTRPLIVDGLTVNAYFQTYTSPATEGPPVTGNFGVRALDDGTSTRVVLFFGTGGIEDEPALSTSPRNKFYALFAAPASLGNDAELIDSFDAVCELGSCEKFYGGVIVSSDQVIYSRVLEPVPGNVDCETGRTVVEARNITGTLDSSLFDSGVSFSETIDGVATGPLSGHGNAIYILDARGRATVVGDPRAGEAGGDTANGTGNGLGGDARSAALINAPMRILGWRQVY
ncbi:PilC/PilY family type IV pilus protein [Haliangium ochraceum]|uniref:Tfp pilus assembly protein tip-associated adhesin PilY1-like protein n=1 Tax=Haliangium ochraceum (strain DSM 14365 / JCM 11303 / SMP-2) TaxID=502025 RepID=D0LHJ4_HALO1|nr:PilC/PilY family type IV pilus protein [Haliangium ochraceum]ACY12856.1 Tfp pilus assembly protein tip-associated adhesin PilY1-like protein [Haliangium ochraceum DSM 14365]